VKLTILGSGTVCPVPDRNASGYLIEAGDVTLQMDMGAGTLGQNARNLDALFLSHIHPDHTADVVPYFFALNYAPGWQREQPLKVFGPKGLGDFLQRLESAWEWVEAKNWQRELRELQEGDQVQLGDLTLKVFQADHGDVEALSLRLEHRGKVLCYSGDTAVCPGLEKAAHRADLFLCECAIPRGYPQRGAHMIADEVGQVATRASAHRVVLTHIYPHGIDLAGQVRDFYTGPVEEASDGATYQV
jgi:ribonuclease BN (tRNA processing enzyme)